MTSVESHSTSGRVEEGKRERMGTRRKMITKPVVQYRTNISLVGAHTCDYRDKNKQVRKEAMIRNSASF